MFKGERNIYGKKKKRKERRRKKKSGLIVESVRLFVKYGSDYRLGLDMNDIDS